MTEKATNVNFRVQRFCWWDPTESILNIFNNHKGIKTLVNEAKRIEFPEAGRVVGDFDLIPNNKIESLWLKD